MTIGIATQNAPRALNAQETNCVVGGTRGGGGIGPAPSPSFPEQQPFDVRFSKEVFWPVLSWPYFW